MRIDPAAALCTVIVTVDGTVEAIAEVMEHAADGLSRFAGFGGFVAGATHVDAGGTRVVQYLQWTSAAAHEACMADPSWSQDPGSRRFMDRMAAGDLAVDVRTVSVAAMVEGGGA